MTSLRDQGNLPDGEVLAVPERVIVAPTSGVFEPAVAEPEPGVGIAVTAGQTIGVIRGPSSTTPVPSPFEGHLMGLLATAGERLRAGEPVAWLRAAA